MEFGPLFRNPPNARFYRLGLARYWWLLLLTSLIGAAIAVYLSSQAPPMYRASAQLLVERTPPHVVDFTDVSPSEENAAMVALSQRLIFLRLTLSPNAETRVRRVYRDRHREEHYLTQQAILQSGSLAQEAVAHLLRQYDVGSGVPPPAGEAGSASSDRQRIRALLGRLRVERAQESRILTISLEGPDPILVTNIINSLTEAYLDLLVEQRVAAIQSARRWLQARVGEERTRTELAERALQVFREQEHILSPQGDEHILLGKMAALNELSVQTRIRRLESEAQTQMFHRMAKDAKLVETFPLVVQNEFIQTLKTNYVAVELEHAELSRRYGLKHPALHGYESQLHTLKGSIAQGIDRIRQSVEMQAQLARSLEADVRRMLEDVKRESFAFHRKAIQDRLLQYEVQSQREMYVFLLRRLHELRVVEQLRVGNASVLDPAEAPAGPIGSRRGRNTVVGLLVGLVIGWGIALGFASADPTVRTVDDLITDTGLPCLGEILQFQRPQEGELIMHRHPHSPIAEAFRHVRTSLILARSQLFCNALVITSIGPEEGKTTVTANLAVALAQAGRRVLLVDADMRRPRLAEIFQVSAEGPGLAQVLGEGCSLDGAVRPTVIEHLSMLPCTTIPENPSELLATDRLPALIASLKERYDFVLFDSPPMLPVSDATILASHLDAVVMVVRAGRTPRAPLRRAIATLTEMHAHVLGGVLNMINPRVGSSYAYAYSSRYQPRSNSLQRMAHS